MWYELEALPGVPAEDAAAYVNRARKAAAALGLADRPGWDSWWRLLVHRDDGMVLLADRTRRWVCLPDGVDGQVVRLVADACHARACPLDGAPEVLERRLVWAHAVFPASATLARTARDTGVDAHESRFDPADGGVVAVNVRRQGVWETRRAKNWLADEFNMAPDQNRLQETGVGACRVVAGMPRGADAVREARRAGTALGLGVTPGVAAHRSRPGFALLLTSAILCLVAALACVLWGAWWPLAVSMPLMVAAVARMVRMPADAPIWQRPRHWWWPHARTRRMETSDFKSRSAGDDSGRRSRRRAKAYAYERSTFPVPPGTLMALAAPLARERGVQSALSHCPPELQDADGPLLGVAVDGQPVRMPAAVMWDGIALLGKPGGGKSNSMHGIQQWACAHSDPDDSVVVFEAKGVDSFPILHRLNPRMRFMDLADARTPMISLLGEGDAWVRAQRFANLMHGALGDQQIGPKSRLQLTDSVALTLRAMDAPRFAQVCASQGVAVPATWVDGAFTLLFGHGARAGRALARAMACALDDDEARETVERLHGGVNERSGRPAVSDGQLFQLLNAPMNKMGLLAGAPQLTDPARRTVTWQRLLEHGVQLAINTGDPARPGVPAMGEDARRLVNALLFQGLRLQIGESCMGWQERGRRVRVFVDELTEITGADGRDEGGNVAAVEWLRSRGRAYGAELCAGTQYPEQIGERLMSCLLGLRTIGCYAQLAPSSAQIMAAALNVDPSQIRALGEHVMCVRTTGRDNTALPALTVAVPWFDGGHGV